MLLKVKLFLSNNRERLSSLPRIGQLAIELAEMERQLLLHSTEASRDKSGYTKSKQIIRQKLEDSIYRIGTGIKAFTDFTETGNSFNGAKSSRSQLARYNSLELMGQAEVTLDYAKHVMANLEPYGVTSTEIEELEALLKEYRNVWQWPKAQRNNRHVARLKTDEILKQMCSLVYGVLDPLVKTFASKWPEGMAYWCLVRRQEKKTYQKRRTRETISLPAGISKLAEQPYNPSYIWTIRNLGKDTIILYLSEDGYAPVAGSKPKRLEPGKTTQVSSKTLGPSGDVLCVRCDGPVSIRMVTTAT